MPCAHSKPLPRASTSASVGHNLAMIADQRSLLILFDAGHSYHAQGLALAPQVTIQWVAQLRAITPISLLLLASLTHRLGHDDQIFDSHLHQLSM
jgi:hypothetical protein